MPALTNLLTEIPKRLPIELFQTILSKSGIRIERIVSMGHATPRDCWYDQEQNEFVVVLQGAAHLRFEGDESLVEMVAGSFIDIQAHRRHRVEWTDPNQPTIWLAVHYSD